MFTHTPTFLPTSTHTHVQYGYTALLLAADEGQEDVVQLLIEVDADPDLQDEVIYRSPDDFKTKQVTVNCGGCTCDVTAAMHVNTVSVVELLLYRVRRQPSWWQLGRGVWGL